MTIYSRPNPSVPVWAESGDKVQPSNPEVQTGWPAASTPPSRQRFNWVLGFAAQGLRYLLQRGIPEWATGEDYPQNARVQHLGATYRALVASPTGAPGDVPGEWEAWGFSAGDISTPPQFDNDNSIATTAFVRQALGSLSGASTISVSGAVSAELAGQVISLSGVGAVSATLPLASSVPAGTAFEFVATTANQSVSRSGSDQIFPNATGVTSIALNAGDSLRVVSDGGAKWLAVGGSAQLGAAAVFGATKSANGLQRLPGGLILQWATGAQVTASAGAVVDTTVALPATFPNALLHVVPTTVYVSGNATTFAEKATGSTTSVIALQLLNGTSTASGTATPRVLAIGW